VSTKTDKRYREIMRTHAGKGGAMRPQNRKKISDNYDRIFEKKLLDDKNEES